MLYGRSVTFQVKTRVLLQRTLGVKDASGRGTMGRVPGRFLLLHRHVPDGRGDLGMGRRSFRDIDDFRDAKQSFGFSMYQVRREERFVGLLHLCLWAKKLLRLSCWHAKLKPIYGAWRKSSIT